MGTFRSVAAVAALLALAAPAAAALEGSDWTFESASPTGSAHSASTRDHAPSEVDVSSEELPGWEIVSSEREVELHDLRLEPARPHASSAGAAVDGTPMSARGSALPGEGAIPSRLDARPSIHTLARAWAGALAHWDDAADAAQGASHDPTDGANPFDQGRRCGSLVYVSGPPNKQDAPEAGLCAVSIPAGGLLRQGAESFVRVARSAIGAADAAARAAFEAASATWDVPSAAAHLSFDEATGGGVRFEAPAARAGVQAPTIAARLVAGSVTVALRSAGSAAQAAPSASLGVEAASDGLAAPTGIPGVGRAASAALDRPHADRAIARDPPSASPLKSSAGSLAESAAERAPVLPLVAAALAVLALLYHRLRGGELPAQATRRAILAEVASRQGLTERGLARAVGVHPTTARYHLRRLVADRLLVARKASKTIHFFLPGHATEGAATREAALASPAARAIVEAARAQPGLGVRDVVLAVALDRTTVHHHVARLAAAGVLRIERGGRALRLHAA